MYSNKLIQYFREPKHAGIIENPSAIGEVGNVKCGDVLRIYLIIENNKIKKIKFQTYGCMAAIAASEAMCKLAKGKTIEEALKITHQDIVKELESMPAIKVHCSVLGRQALQKAIENYRKNN